MEPEIDGVEKKPFLPFHPSCIVDSCQQPYPYCDSPFLSLTWVNGLNFHYDKHTGSRGWFYLVNWKMDVLEKAVMSNRFTHSWAVIWSVIQNKDQKHLCAPTYLVNAEPDATLVSIEPDLSQADVWFNTQAQACPPTEYTPLRHCKHTLAKEMWNRTRDIHQQDSEVFPSWKYVSEAVVSFCNSISISSISEGEGSIPAWPCG